MADGEVVYEVRVDSSDGINEARRAGNEMGNALNESGSGHSSTWKEIWTGAARKIGAEIVDLGISAAKALGNAVIDITKSAVEGFAEQEQLIGGAKLMYGDAYDFIADKAANAYKTVQLSQNEYLTQVNGFATGLKTALGGNAQAAAELADRIVTAEADVVAATGNSREAVENAFNGIMKSNYTMLDNLQLGITPTKEGFQEVIDKVNEWNAANGKATDYQIDNLADCQSALVDYIEMQGLAGYAANEAADTIQGSVGMMKSAWSNLVTGLADENADFDQLLQNFIDSVETVGENLIPVVETALNGIVDLIDGLLPVLIDKLPEILETLLPNIVEALGSILEAIITFFSENAEQLADMGVELLMQLIEGLFNALPQLLEATVNIVSEMLMKIGDHLPEFLEMAVQLIVSMVTGLAKAIPQLLGAVVKLIADILAAFFNTDWDGVGSDILNGIWKGLKAGWNWLKEKVREIARSLLDAAKAVLGINSPSKEFAWIGKMNILGTEEGMEDQLPDLTRTVTTIYRGIVDKAQAVIDAAPAIDALPSYSLGDVERHISATFSATGTASSITITVPLFMDGREIARATAWNMGEQLAWEEML